PGRAWRWRHQGCRRNAIEALRRLLQRTPGKAYPDAEAGQPGHGDRPTLPATAKQPAMQTLAPAAGAGFALATVERSTGCQNPGIQLRRRLTGSLGAKMCEQGLLLGQSIRWGRIRLHADNSSPANSRRNFCRA